MTTITGIVTFIVCSFVSLIIFAVFVGLYKVAMSILNVADKACTTVGAFLVLIATALSPIAVSIAIIRNHRLIRKYVIAVFIVLSLFIGFSYGDMIYWLINQKVDQYIASKIKLRLEK